MTNFLLFSFFVIMAKRIKRIGEPYGKPYPSLDQSQLTMLTDDFRNGLTGCES